MCSGYLPPEYLFQQVVSKKLDVFSLGVVITKIIAGPKGNTRRADMPYQDYLDEVQSLISSLHKNGVNYSTNIMMHFAVEKKDHSSSYTLITQVRENWRNRLEATGASLRILEAYCEQVSICTEIGVSSMETDRDKRPTIVDIIDRLDETETMIEKVTSFC
jgi:serine/threonine protein kinase